MFDCWVLCFLLVAIFAWENNSNSLKITPFLPILLHTIQSWRKEGIAIGCSIVATLLRKKWVLTAFFMLFWRVLFYNLFIIETLILSFCFFQVGSWGGFRTYVPCFGNSVTCCYQLGSVFQPRTTMVIGQRLVAAESLFCCSHHYWLHRWYWHL